MLTSGVKVPVEVLVGQEPAATEVVEEGKGGACVTAAQNPRRIPGGPFTTSPP